MYTEALITLIIILLAVCFLLGSIPCGKIVAKRLAGIDLTKEGSGNVGAANASRTGGAKVGLLTFALDALKAAVAMLIATYFAVGLMNDDPYYSINLGGAYTYEVDWAYLGYAHLDILLAVALLCVILGHIFSPWLHWRGGKGVSAVLGGVLVIAPLPGLIAFGCFFIILFWKGYLSLASIVGAAVLPLLTYLFYPHRPVLAIGVAITVIIIILAHKGNIVRLMHKTEPKFSFAKKKS